MYRIRYYKVFLFGAFVVFKAREAVECQRRRKKHLKKFLFITYNNSRGRQNNKLSRKTLVILSF